MQGHFLQLFQRLGKLNKSAKFSIKTPPKGLSRTEENKYFEGQAGLAWNDPTLGSGLMIEVFPPKNRKKIVSQKYAASAKVCTGGCISGRQLNWTTAFF